MPEQLPVEPPTDGQLTGAKPWYESKGVIGALVTTGAIVLNMVGFNVGEVLQEEIVEATLSVVAIAGTVYGLIGRLVATKEVTE
ncbi:MAG: hypothetical protein MK081_13315 [Flavobacteriales bacterium]|nr:hypothetical protein [Flavobacteriales bacterium]